MNTSLIHISHFLIQDRNLYQNSEEKYEIFRNCMTFAKEKLGTFHPNITAQKQNNYSNKINVNVIPELTVGVEVSYHVDVDF